MDIAALSDTLKTTFLPHIKSIQSFHFYYNNPLLWISFIAVFFMLVWLRNWSRRKSFFFCSTIALLLLAVTTIERSMGSVFASGGEGFDPFIIRVIFFLTLSGAVLYFVFIDNS